MPEGGALPHAAAWLKETSSGYFQLPRRGGCPLPSMNGVPSPARTPVWTRRLRAMSLRIENDFFFGSTDASRAGSCFGSLFIGAPFVVTGITRTLTCHVRRAAGRTMTRETLR